LYIEMKAAVRYGGRVALHSYQTCMKFQAELDLFIPHLPQGTI
jgi:hypothetical protein